MAAVLVHIDCDGELPHPSSLHALSAARTVASSWGATLYAAIFVCNPGDTMSADSTTEVVAQPATRRRASTGGSPSSRAPTAPAVPGAGLSTSTDVGSATRSLQQALASAGADKVVVVITDTEVAPLWASVGGAWQQVLEHLRPRLVLFGAGAPSAADLAPRTAARTGARMLLRARIVGRDLVELRDRDGGYVRAADSGAAVALIGTGPLREDADANIDCVLLVAPGGADGRVDVVGAQLAELAHTEAVVVAIGDDAIGDAATLASARRLATLLGAPLVGSAAAARAGAIEAGAVIERTTPLAPELCIAIGNAMLDLAGTTSLIRIAASERRGVEAALVGPVAENLAALVAALEARAS